MIVPFRPNEIPLAKTTDKPTQQLIYHWATSPQVTKILKRHYTDQDRQMEQRDYSVRMPLV